ncbi:cell envelope biogenesis protein TolA [Bradyrhizobium sp. LjRoot220]|uniref:cell envelope biogenesis protein TolA n=1 Tax=Bradyrhizobium sp. LjRoot220 TaxID=3342284 RepID=UPI003ED029F0
MARKLKTYQTSLGFYDQAVAAPSMKAALDAWGAESNLFHQGAARESTDPEVVAATMAKPGVVLRRPVGSNGRFTEHAGLPTDLAGDEIEGRPAKRRAKPKKQPPRKTDDKAARKAALEYERAERQREAERRKEAAARAKERQRREQAVAKANAALDEARREHDSTVSALEAERAALDKRTQAEQDRWDQQKQKLEAALRRARE